MTWFVEQVGRRWAVNNGRKRIPGVYASRNEALAAMREQRAPQNEQIGVSIVAPPPATIRPRRAPKGAA
jgi:hypothetical protein